MPKQSGEYSQNNAESMFLAFAIAIPVVMVLGWMFFGKYVYAYERLAIYWVLSFGGMVPTDFPVWGWVTRQYLFFRYTKAKDIGFTEDAVPDSLIVNMVLIVPIAIFAFRNFMHASSRHPFSRYGRQMNLYDYMYDQFPLYPHLRTMWKLRLLGRPLDKGLFRKPDSVKDLCVFNDLVALPSEDGEPVVNEVKAAALFRSHLGALMPKPTDDEEHDAQKLIELLTPNQKAVIAAIVPRLAACDEDATDEIYDDGIKTSEKLTKQFWETFDDWRPNLPDSKEDNPDDPLNPPPPVVNTSGCDEVLMKFLQQPIVRKSMTSHAYINTFIYDAFQACRRVGKFPSCDLRWIMMTDRTFWLTLSSAGRREPFWECAGIHAHYLYERKLGAPCERPQVAEAVYALVDELDNRMKFSQREKTALWRLQDAATAKQAKMMADQRARDKTRKAKEAAKN